MKHLHLFWGAAALAAVVMTASPVVNAQENGNRDMFGNVVRGPYQTNRFGDNWFIGVGGGINILLNEGYDVKIGPSLDVNVGKWITPAIGLRAGYQGLNAWVLPEGIDADMKLGYVYAHGDVLWNMSDAIGGYKETRFWDLVPYMHAGYFRGYGLDGVDFVDNELAVGAGLLHNLRLADRLDLIIDMRATVVNGRVMGSDGPAVLPSVTAGLAVDLGWPNFVRTSSVIGAIEAANLVQIEALEAATLALEAANANLQKQNKELAAANTKMTKEMSAMKNQVKTDMTDFFSSMTPAALYFDIGKAVLDAKQLQTLDFLAKNIIAKANADTKIYMTVMGSADSNTGSKSLNMHLSEARGKYIFDILTTQYGISADRLIVKSEVVKAKSHPELSRSVIISF